jgi:soluble lytic murein transglycosylase-like protein
MQHRASSKPLRRASHIVRWARVSLALAGLAIGQAAYADCFDDAAAYEHVNPMLLRAIAWQESHNRSDATHSNNNGTIDYGLMQINSVHMPALSQYGISLGTLMEPCANVYIGAWHLRRQMLRYGDTWQAVGAYHSATPALRDQYGQQIYAILVGWNQVGDLPPPLPSNFPHSTDAIETPKSARNIVKPSRSVSKQSGVLIYRGAGSDNEFIHRPPPR